MKKTLTFFLFVTFLCLCTQTVLLQEKKQENKKQEKQELKTEATTEVPKKTAPSYNPAGRKDPFRDLLTAQEETTTTPAEGEPQISIDNITLIGIAKARGQYTAIVTGPEDFPIFIKIGHKFTDGFVLKIDESKVIFRKTKERGVLLFKPKDVVKEIILEEIR